MRIFVPVLVLLAGCSGTSYAPSPVEEDAATLDATPDAGPKRYVPPPSVDDAAAPVHTVDAAPPSSCLASSAHNNDECAAFERFMRRYTWLCTGDAVPDPAAPGGCESPSGTGVLGLWCCASQ